MFRALTAVVAAVLLSTAGWAAPQHVHAYADHDHADHQHGPASHQHAPAHHGGSGQAAHDGHSASSHGATVESCDPGAHAVAVGRACVAPLQMFMPLAVVATAAGPAPPHYRSQGVTDSDDRAHSPPRLTDAPLRAPPA